MDVVQAGLEHTVFLLGLLNIGRKHVPAHLARFVKVRKDKTGR